MNTDFVVNVSTLPAPFVGRFQTNGTKMSDEDFERFCQQNSEMRIEQTKEGEIIVMPGTGGLTGNRNFKLIGLFAQWHYSHKSGIAFDYSTVFVLPNGAKRSPDLSWIKSERWDALTKREQEKFPPLCPNLVVELRSMTDSLKSLQAKMIEYIENGAQLGWLIDPAKRKVHVYRQGEALEILDAPAEVSGEPLLPRFTLKLADFWD